MAQLETFDVSILAGCNSEAQRKRLDSRIKSLIEDYCKVVSLNLFKNEVIPLGSSNCGAIKQVSADVWAIAGGQYFVVEKSSAFAIGSSDGYEIRAAYYE